jgi:hypothetical protein
VAFTLETAADYYIFSPRLVRLGTGQSFEVTFKPVRINEAPDEKFGHAVEFWLFQSVSPPTDLDTDGFGVSLLWGGEGDWIVSSRKPVEHFTQTGLRVQIELGSERVARIARRNDGALEFFIGGSSVLTLSDVPPADNVFSRVVGMRADFSYVPFQVNPLLSVEAPSPWPCGLCPGPREPRFSRGGVTEHIR